MKNLLIGICLLVILNPIFGQQFENIKAEIDNDEVTVYYDLISPNPNGLYHVDIYGSHDQYSSALKLVRGDVGGNITPGRGKSISWLIGSELKNYDGLINFELRGSPVSSSRPSKSMKLSLLTPNSSSRFKVDNAYSITWSGGSNTDHVNLQLYLKKRKVHDIASKWENSGNLNFKIPGQLSTSGKYWITIVDTGDPANNDKTPYFRIKNPRRDFYNIALMGITVASLIMLQSAQNN